MVRLCSKPFPILQCTKSVKKFDTGICLTLLCNQKVFIQLQLIDHSTAPLIYSSFARNETLKQRVTCIEILAGRSWRNVNLQQSKHMRINNIAMCHDQLIRMCQCVTTHYYQLKQKYGST